MKIELTTTSVGVLLEQEEGLMYNLKQTNAPCEVIDVIEQIMGEIKK